MSETTAILSEIKVSGAKKPSERDFIRDIVRKIEERILMECLTSNDVFLRVDYRSGSVEVRMTSSGENEPSSRLTEARDTEHVRTICP